MPNVLNISLQHMTIFNNYEMKYIIIMARKICDSKNFLLLTFQCTINFLK